MDKRIFFFMIVIFSQVLGVESTLGANIVSFNLSPSTLTLPDQDPDSFPETSSVTDLTVSFSIRQLRPTENWVLEIYSDGDLVSGTNVVPIENARWTVTGTGNGPAAFQNGTLTKGVYIKAGEGSGGIGGRADVTCNFRFYLRNLWSYGTGNYLKTLTLRLTVPGEVQLRTFALSSVINARAKLELGPQALNFPDADPDTFPSIPAGANPFSVISSTRTGSAMTSVLTCLASGDLLSGAQTIPIGNLRWEASGSGYVSGRMSKTAGQTAGSWVGSGKRIGSLNYFLSSSWSYITGRYSTTIVYTLQAP